MVAGALDSEVMKHCDGTIINEKVSTCPSVVPAHVSKRKRTESGGGLLDRKFPSKRSVTFSVSVSVVLIPERVEYKSARVESELWWSRADFQSFHQSAFSELKLFSICENINSREARKLLYQPTLEESCAAQVHLSEVASGLPSCSSTEKDDVKSAFENEMVELHSPILAKKDSDSDSDSVPKIHFMRHRSSVAMDLCSASDADSHSPAKGPSVGSRRVDGSATARDDAADPFDFLSLCVPAQEPQQLATWERQHGGPGGRISGRRSSRGRSNSSSDGSSSSAFHGANGITLFLGLCSFTLPIFGYYIMHYCQ